MDFIDKKYILTMKVGKDSCQVSGPLNSRARGNPEVNPHLSSNDKSQCSLAQTGRAVEQQMIQSFTPALGGSDGNVYIVLNLYLPIEVSETSRSQAGIKGCVLNVWFTRYDASYFLPASFDFLTLAPFPFLLVIGREGLYFLERDSSFLNNL